MPSPHTRTPTSAIVAPGSPSPIPKPAGKTVVALYNFEAVEEGDLCLVEGEAYEVVDNSREHWWQVRNKHGQMGFIPSNYVEATPGLTKHEWYAVDLTRQKCETVLREDNKDGCFIVRNSSTQGMYTLSLLAKVPGGPQVKHYHIKRNEEGSYFLSEKHTFESIEQLVLFHKVNSGGLATRLKNPPKNLVRPAPTPPGLGHGKWEIDHSELELLEEVGSGQFGVVRKAKWRGHLYVAVKMMKEGTMSEKEFIKEAQLMTKGPTPGIRRSCVCTHVRVGSKGVCFHVRNGLKLQAKAIQHPNLVRLFGVCSQTRPIFIVTEYMKYGSLLTYLRQHTNRLINKPGSLLDMCLQVCSGMAYLELCNYIHRDLAARNCLVTSGNTVKVADFGLARWVKDDEYQSSGGAKFPIKWAPPEVLNFTRFSSKSDVWAYGVLMWEVFTCGKMPYGRMANAEVARYVVQDGRRLERPRNCPPEVYELMTSCWHYSPPDRPAFRTLKLKLEAILEDTV
ncbi:BTK [Cordylochernes scorpioides]|uniref:Tyrosine-protein kinase n=1 Tax=Cordylochernes scorpioides TaxID=51811 RepID=A0ABY6JWW2_9ARAC|nr:BTK [Cordylochernes scorpioides]